MAWQLKQSNEREVKKIETQLTRMDSTGKMFPKENQMRAKFTDLSAVGAPLGPNLASIGLIGHGFQL